MRNFVRKLVPRRIRQDILRQQETQARNRLFGPLAPLVPAVEDMFDGPASLEEFKANGEEFFQIYKEICRLQPHEWILDVGSGIGERQYRSPDISMKEHGTRASTSTGQVPIVLAPGRCLISYFLLNEESKRLIEAGAGWSERIELHE